MLFDIIKGLRVGAINKPRLLIKAKRVQFIRSVLFKTIFYTSTVLFIIFMALASIFSPKPRPIMRCIEGYGSYVLWLARWMVGVKTHFIGFDKLPENPPYIVCPKHESTMDVFLLISRVKYVTALGKSEYFDLPIMGFLLRRMGILSVIRNKGTAHMELPDMKNYMEKDPRPLLIYPEGTRVKLGNRVKLKSGAWHIQQETGLDVYPIATNVASLWPRKKILINPGTVIMEVGEVIKPGLDKEAFIAELEKRVVDRSIALRDPDALK